MVEAMVTGLANLFEPLVFIAIVVGVIVGLFFGLLPAISTLPIMAVAIPLTFGMEPIIALSLLMGILALGTTGGSITAILVCIPGTPINAATLLDGFPMTKKGMGGRACGAALASSGVGGIFGGLCLAALIPVAYAIVMGFGIAEQLMLVVLGLAFISVLSAGSTLKGLASGLVGILLSFIGMHSVTGFPRLSFGSLYLYDGINIIVFCIGIFALPPIFDLALKGGGESATIADRSVLAQTGWPQVWEGMKDVMRHWRLFLRSSVIGTIIGIVPGIGGLVATFVAYGQAKLTSKNPERFGQGIVEGVIAPEAANNAKEGGALVPTLAFGIPGSVGMAVMLAALMIHGIAPGPGMLKEHLDLTWSLVFVLIIGNILGVAFLLPFIGTLAKVAFIRSSVLVPIILALCFFGAYAFRGEFWDILATFIFGVAGYLMMKYGFNTIALMLGFILGEMAENYLFIAYSIEGFAFLLRPTVIILWVITILVLAYDRLSPLYRKRRGKT